MVHDEVKQIARQCQQQYPDGNCQLSIPPDDASRQRHVGEDRRPLGRRQPIRPLAHRKLRSGLTLVVCPFRGRGSASFNVVVDSAQNPNGQQIIQNSMRCMRGSNRRSNAVLMTACSRYVKHSARPYQSGRTEAPGIQSATGKPMRRSKPIAMRASMQYDQAIAAAALM
jgi:hypothetical protein